MKGALKASAQISGETGMRRHAAEFAEHLEAGTLLALEGDLGAGKTVFVRGLVEGLRGNAEQVSSPSFVLAIEHRDCRPPLLHLDLYRLADGSGVDDLGIEEALERGWIVAVEWAERLPRHLRQTAWRVLIARGVGQDLDQRTLSIMAPERR